MAGPLALSALVLDCQRVDVPLGTLVGSRMMKEVGAIEMETLDPPGFSVIVPAPSSVALPAKAVQFEKDLRSLASGGSLPASVRQAADEMAAALSAAEIGVLADFNVAFNPSPAENTLPADLRRAVERAAAHPALAAYLPTVTLPAVRQVAAPATAPPLPALALKEFTQRANSCTKQADEAFVTAKSRLETQRKGYFDAFLSTYNERATAAAAAEAGCKTTTESKYAALRQAEHATASLNAAHLNSASLDKSTQRLLKALVNFRFIESGLLLNLLEREDLKACTQARTSTTTAALVAQRKGESLADDAYVAAMRQVIGVVDRFTADCLNQQGHAN